MSIFPLDILHSVIKNRPLGLFIIKLIPDLSLASLGIFQSHWKMEEYESVLRGIERFELKYIFSFHKTLCAFPGRIYRMYLIKDECE